MVEQITSDQVIKFLGAKQPTFTEALMEFGTKYDRGFEWGHRKSKYSGEFTGEKLCTIAVSIMEEGLTRRYENIIATIPQAFSTYCMDPETHLIKHLAAQPHRNLHFRLTTEENWYLADPTFRQFQIEVDPNEMLIGIPVVAQDRLYSIEGRLTPIKPGYLYGQHLRLMKLGDFEGIRPEDYEKLLEVFLSD